MSFTRITTKIFGTERVRKRMENMTGLVPKAIAQGLYLEGNNIMAESKKLVPVDWGTLRDSGYVTLPEVHGGNLVTELGYGGPAAEYAVVQHEHIEFQHPEGGEAKYLEKPFLTRAPSVPQNVAKLARAAMEVGVAISPSKAPGMPTTPTEGPFPPDPKRRKRKK